MSKMLALLPLIAPLALVAVAVLAGFEPGRRPRRVLWAARVATLGALVLAAIAAATVVLNAVPVVSPVLGIGEFGLAVRLDALSTVMFGLVAFVGVIVIQFSRNYLDGDPRHGAFVGDLCLTLAAVLLFVLSGNLIQLVVSWVATSLALHRLLLFYQDRPAAVVAARKKFVVARIGDACVVLAAILLVHAFGTADIGTILDRAHAALADGETMVTAQLAALLFVVAALLKSAQFPTHGWLPEVMETPTPVSALLHAGIINAGGFLVVRFADVMLLSAPSLHVLALVGGFTALFGSVVMLTQTSVKVSLAYSTVAQMGFMLLQCGLGAFSAAILHIVAHSLYKAHAFLSSGSAVEIARASSSLPVAERKTHPIRILASLSCALAIFVGIGALLGVSVDDKPAIIVLGAILVMGLTHLLAKAVEGKPDSHLVGRMVLAASATSLVYFLLQMGAERLLASALPVTPPPDALTIAVMVLAVTSFGLVTVLQLLAPVIATSGRSRAAYVHLANGLYVNALFNRLVDALRRSATANS